MLFSSAIYAHVVPCGEQDYDCLIAEASRAISANPNSAADYAKRGMAYYGKKDFQSAISDFTKLLALNPDSEAAHVYRGIAYADSGNAEAAINDYNQAISINPNSAAGYFYRGFTFASRGKYKEAAADFQKTLQIKPGDAEVQKYLDAVNQQLQAEKQEKQEKRKAFWQGLAQAVDQMDTGRGAAQTNQNNSRAAGGGQSARNTPAGGGNNSSMGEGSGIGAKYGARDPRTCANTKSPSSGAISAEQATIYVLCSQEGVQSDYLYLLENVQVEIGASRPYNYYSDSYATSIDTTAPVYPIRGSFDQYQCGTLYADHSTDGKNCTLYRQPKAEGKCYKTTFGDWFCSMHDTSNNDSNRKFYLPPPQ